MSEKGKRVLVYEQDHQTASYIAFGARQFDLLPVTARTQEEAVKLLKEGPVGIAFINTDLPDLLLPDDVSIVPILDESNYRHSLKIAYSYFSVLYKPADIVDVMAILKNILDADAGQRKDYTFHMLRSGMILRYLKFFLSVIQQDPNAQFTMKESLYQFCVGQCRNAVSGDALENDGQKKYRLLTVSLQHGKRQCALLEACKLHEFSRWLQEQHATIAEKKPYDLFPNLSENAPLEKMRETVDRLLEKQQGTMQSLHALKKEFCTNHCDVSRNGTDFKEGYVLISEWSDIFRNQCIYCAQPDCPLNEFFDLLVYRLKMI